MTSDHSFFPVKIHFVGVQPDQPSIALYRAVQGKKQLDAIDQTGTDLARFERLRQNLADYFIPVSADEADLFIYPHPYNDGPQTRDAGKLAKQRGRPCLFFRGSDSLTPELPDWGIVYRTSIAGSLVTPKERAMPAFSDDFLRERKGNVLLREKKDVPSIGFCGYVGTPAYRILYRLQGRHQKARGLKVRNAVLRLLEQAGVSKTDFIRRSQFWGGALSRFKNASQAATTVRQEYLDSLLKNDYIVCVRGAGNFSFRFYETLAIGRIPLFINTDCLLPFADEIDWRKHCVWIEEEELGHIGEKIHAFHRNISDEEFKNMQLRNRKLWEQYLRPLECYQNICRREIRAFLQNQA
ncbi:MAG: hypothetical protein CMJ81_16845 [Planctomycetaceae bacterium]|nr:hypothetical protein [Planctomycetaceae bacterium]MBP62973.1 hypothetical protein [Planctomycetaceae bacterium]